MKLVIVNYDTGNIQSLKNAFSRLNTEAILSDDPEVIASASHVILPGVGHASTALNAIRSKGLETVIKSLRQPVLGICLGMQILFDSTDETPIPGLGILSGKVKLIEADVKIPHMGWNQVSQFKSSLFNGFTEAEYVYFVHSYFVNIDENTSAVSEYHKPFAAAVSKNNFYACQFHPEKSGKVGQRILKNFLNLS